MTAAEIAAALGNARREGRGWRCRCPLHGGVSLTLCDGESALLVKCWAGCNRLDVLAELRRLGLDEVRDTKPRREIVQRDDTTAKQRTASALQIWNHGCDIGGTLAERYLTARKLVLPEGVSGCTLRFIARCPFGAGKHHPAMVALYTGLHDDLPCAISRTALTPDGQKIDRKMLGPIKGTACKLTADEDVAFGLHIAEGIESGLAAMMFGLVPMWALGSAGAIAAFPVLDGIEALTILVDHDDNDVGQRAARQCGERWTDAGCEVRCITPRIVGEDVADLVGRVAP
jgi:hypothetical protein